MNRRPRRLSLLRSQNGSATPGIVVAVLAMATASLLVTGVMSSNAITTRTSADRDIDAALDLAFEAGMRLPHDRASETLPTTCVDAFQTCVTSSRISLTSTTKSLTQRVTVKHTPTGRSVTETREYKGTAATHLTGYDAAGNPTWAMGGYDYNPTTVRGDGVCYVQEERAYCWGPQATRGSVQTSLKTSLVDGNISWRSVSGAFGDHACGAAVDGAAWCWGKNTTGQLGNATTSTATTMAPVRVSGTTQFNSIDVSQQSSCGLDKTGAAWCWGLNSSGQLGIGSTTNRTIPTAVSGGLKFKDISTGKTTCGVTTAGKLYCWGSGAAGALGNGGTANAPTPVAVSTSGTFTQVSSDDRGACALDDAGSLWCWGDNSTGALGNGTTSPASAGTPVKVTMPSSPININKGPYVDISAAGNGSRCVAAVSSNGRAGSICWGWQVDRQGAGPKATGPFPATSTTTMSLMPDGTYGDVTVLDGSAVGSCEVASFANVACRGYIPDSLGTNCTSSGTAIPVVNNTCKDGGSVSSRRTAEKFGFDGSSFNFGTYALTWTLDRVSR